ncbi:MAG: hypothetical protein KAQ93_00210 [Spirochaetales bacterium]|nr:hypothetical protein [Spirochaetales bacterium]
MKTTISGIVIVLLLALIFPSCKTSLSDGTVTVGLTGAESVNGDYLYAYVYLKGETDTDNPATVLAFGSEQIASGLASMVLKVDDGAWGATGVDWIGSGEVYDIYIYTDDVDNSPDEDTAKMTDPMPMEITIDGNINVDILFEDMVAYKGSGS